MFTVQKLASYIRGEWAGKYQGSEKERVLSVAIRSKAVNSGSVFFALSQPDYEQNCFNTDFGDTNPLIPKALANGAVFCVTRKDAYQKHAHLLAPYADRILFVSDTIRAIQVLAKEKLNSTPFPIIGITGSAGKTTTKELTAHILKKCGKTVLYNKRNQNNGLGVPLTFLRESSSPNPEYGVIEMGMSSPNNEIKRLCEICPPRIAVVLNVLPVHLQHLGSIEKIAQAKEEILWNSASSATAIINNDDNIVRNFTSHKRRTLTFGISRTADIQAVNIIDHRSGFSAKIRTPDGSFTVFSQLRGIHNVYNVLAAVAVAYTLEISVNDTIGAIEDFYPLPQRGLVLHLGRSITIIDESYNSNPLALEYAVKAAEGLLRSNSRLILIAGEMQELGPDESLLHYKAGESIGSSKVGLFIGVGALTAEIAKGAISKRALETRVFHNKEEALEFLLLSIRPNDVILIKGSRSGCLEELVKSIYLKFRPSSV
jgi:UDP-N-acetylmuramoyl-tripeptide--D-alanyl-D-alanine ligase